MLLLQTLKDGITLIIIQTKATYRRTNITNNQTQQDKHDTVIIDYRYKINLCSISVQTNHSMLKSCGQTNSQVFWT